MSFTRTRIAPTPSGYLHLGNILSFVITAEMARRTGARVFLRIDDLDRERCDPRYVEDIFSTLDFLGLAWDEGPSGPEDFERNYSQLHRMDLYHEALEELRENGLLFACSCSRSELARTAPDGGYPGTCRGKVLAREEAGDGQKDRVNWRLRTETTGLVPVNLVFPYGGWEGAAEYPFPPKLRDLVVRQKNGFPAYHLGSVVDDHHFGIDLIVRGGDLWESTLAQHYLARQLNSNRFPAASFFHHPLLLNAQGVKMSKSAGDTSVQYLRNQGCTAATIYAMLGRLVGAAAGVQDWPSLAAALPVFHQVKS